MPMKDMATSTSTFGFIRTLGGTVGISIGQAIFGSTVTKKIAKIPNVTLDTSPGVLSASVRKLKDIPDPTTRAAVINAYARSISTIWLVMMPIVVVSFVLVLFVRKYSLKRTIVRNGEPEKPDQIADPEKGIASAGGAYATPTVSESTADDEDNTIHEKRSDEKDKYPITRCLPRAPLS
ncbi:hypothetical protein H0H81_000914 [Sphagnurus paluster]|uniref:Uncharacterized protein n=1 Tax=Sphagnurus paluster TaxID=117069 RepID=A0A9P7FWA0_9AGAR|nr:hypothetical protein H0H81_000914 [Sphagnurus paluster]